MGVVAALSEVEDVRILAGGLRAPVDPSMDHILIVESPAKG